MARASELENDDFIEIDEIKFVKRVQCIKPGIYKLTAPSGRVYTSVEHSILTIEDEEDFNYIISIKAAKSCCGGSPSQNIFIEV